MTRPIYGPDGARIGIEDVSGIRLAPSKAETAAYAEAESEALESLCTILAEQSREEDAVAAFRADDALRDDPRTCADEHPRMAYDEIHAVRDALNAHAHTHTRTAYAERDDGPVVVDAAPNVLLRLRNRGLVNEANELDAERLAAEIRDARREREQAPSGEAEGAPFINLIIATSESQTSAPAVSSTPEMAARKSRCKPSKPSDLPRRASKARLDSAKITTGVRLLGETDHAVIDRRFSDYLDAIDDRVICMSDADGYTVGAEYSTRFNDIRKVRYQLDKFDYAHDRSLEEFSSAVFLTLTTDPNLTDEERAQAKSDAVAKMEARLERGGLTAHQAEKIRHDIACEKGPDTEIGYLEERLRTASDPGRKLGKRLDRLLADRERSVPLIAEYNDPRTAPRRREAVREELVRMRRLPASHDDEGFESMWEANRAFQAAWNRFMSYVAKRNDGVRPKYIVSFEFTRQGLLHAHAILFLNWLATNAEIAREWHRCGQGSVTYIYALRRTRNRRSNKLEWRWASSSNKPPDAKSVSGGDYLKKYLKKAMMGRADKLQDQSRVQSLYWVFNKRFWSCSRSLLNGFTSGLAPRRRDPDMPSRFSYWRTLPSEAADPEAGIVDRIVYHRWRPYDPQQTLDGAGGAAR